MLPNHFSCTFSSRGMAAADSSVERTPLQISLSQAMCSLISNLQTLMGMVWLTWSHQQAPHCSTSSEAPVFQLPLHAAARQRATRRPAHVSARRALTAPSAAFAAGIIRVKIVKMGCARVALASAVCQARIQPVQSMNSSNPRSLSSVTVNFQRARNPNISRRSIAKRPILCMMNFLCSAGTCSHRGTCDDDEDARRRQAEMNVTGFTHDSATGTGICKCSAP